MFFELFESLASSLVYPLFNDAEDVAVFTNPNLLQWSDGSYIEWSDGTPVE